MSSKSRACSRKAPALLSRGRVVGGGNRIDKGSKSDLLWRESFDNYW